MLKQVKGLIGLSLLLSLLVQNANAAFLKQEDLSEQELAEINDFIATDVKADLMIHFEERAREVVENASRDPINKILMADPLTPETREIMTKGVYHIVAGAMIQRGMSPPNEKTFNDNLGKALDYVSRMGIFPQALTFGYMVRAQAVVGGSYGTQFNLYFDQGKFKLASYTVYGVQAGFSAMVKEQFYASFCFGTCFGGEANGWYVGLDSSMTAGIGAGFFAEFGIDVTDLWKTFWRGESYSLKDMYQSKAIYLGFDIEFGIGGGLSADVFHYREDYEKVLWEPSSKLGPVNSISQFKMR